MSKWVHFQLETFLSIVSLLFLFSSFSLYLPLCIFQSFPFLSSPNLYIFFVWSHFPLSSLSLSPLCVTEGMKEVWINTGMVWKSNYMVVPFITTDYNPPQFSSLSEEPNPPTNLWGYVHRPQPSSLAFYISPFLSLSLFNVFKFCRYIGNITTGWCHINHKKSKTRIALISNVCKWFMFFRHLHLFFSIPLFQFLFTKQR